MATDTEGLNPNEMGPPVVLRSTTGDNSANQTSEIQCRQSMGIVPVKQVLYEALINDAERVLIDCTVQESPVTYLVLSSGRAFLSSATVVTFALF